MSTISLRMSEEDFDLLQEYVSVHNINLSSFVREAILDKIEDELEIDESKILSAYKESFKEKSIDHTEVWEKLGV